MSLAMQMQADVGAVFTNTGDFGVAISYQRGTLTVPLNALVGSTVFETSAEFGITRTETRDYLFDPTLLILGGLLKLPERGDVIVENNRRYVATSPQGQSTYVYEDENRLMIRVHTTLTKDS